MAKHGIIKLDRNPEDRTVSVTVKGFESKPMVYTIGTNPDADDYAALHGLGQKFVDAGAISRNPETGLPATAADKYNAIRVVFDRINSGGPWNAEREGGVAGGGLLFETIRRVQPDLDAEQVRAFVKGLTPAQRIALSVDPEYRDVYAEVKAERDARQQKAAASTDVESLKAALRNL